MTTETLPKVQRFITAGGYILNTDLIKHVGPDMTMGPLEKGGWGTTPGHLRVEFINHSYVILNGVTMDQMRTLLNGDPF